MKLPRRKLLDLMAGAAAFSTLSRIAGAQTYPSRPVRIVVGFAPGGPNDINARLIGHWLSERLGQQFIIDNRPGASGNIAMESVVRSPPNGYTLVMVALSSGQRDPLRQSSFRFSPRHRTGRNYLPQHSVYGGASFGSGRHRP
jgi:tripartite-type tricarboxylate transporter receptor subunit TctC